MPEQHDCTGFKNPPKIANAQKQSSSMMSIDTMQLAGYVQLT
jgi:hypothetical protein